MAILFSIVEKSETVSGDNETPTAFGVRTPKKKFIDKKNAVTFQIVHRSQRDPLITDETAPCHVLVPLEAKKHDIDKQDGPNEPLLNQKEEQIKYGIYFDDQYNYLQHLKTVDDPINVEWAPVKTPVTKKEDLKEIRLKLPSSVFESDFQEDVGLLNKAAPQSGPRLDFDPDIVAGLDDDFDYENEENVLQDDFMKFANSDLNLEEENDNINDDEWKDENSDEGTICDSEDAGSGRFSFDDEQDPFKDEETKSRFTSYSMTSSVLRRNDMLTLLDDRFEKIYEQYDDTEVGALDTEEIDGYLNLSDDRLIDLAKEFEQKIEEERLISDNMVSPQKEDILIIEKLPLMHFSGLLLWLPFPYQRSRSYRKHERFDCVSILTQTPRSEYMPTIIDIPSNKPKKIKISSRTGIPLDTLGKVGLTKANLDKLDRINEVEKRTKDFEDDSESLLSTLSVMSIRAKNETPEERRARKSALKEYRRVSFFSSLFSVLALNAAKYNQFVIEISLKERGSVQTVKY
nr:EOG090X08PQ [Artemia franciscana]